jgi:hypothetical protein
MFSNKKADWLLHSNPKDGQQKSTSNFPKDVLLMGGILLVGIIINILIIWLFLQKG